MAYAAWKGPDIEACMGQAFLVTSLSGKALPAESPTWVSAGQRLESVQPLVVE